MALSVLLSKGLLNNRERGRESIYRIEYNCPLTFILACCQKQVVAQRAGYMTRVRAGTMGPEAHNERSSKISSDFLMRDRGIDYITSRPQ